MTSRCLRSLVLFVLFVLPPLLFAVRADASVLQKVDAALNRATSWQAQATLILRDASGSTRSQQFMMWSRGKMRRTMHTAPADLKCFGFLVRSNEQMYLYMPAFHKVRRIASSITHKGFMDSDFSYDDISDLTFADKYHGRITLETARIHALELQPLSGTQTQWSALEMRVSKEDLLPRKIVWFMGSKKIRQLDVLRVTTIADIPMMTQLQMTNLATGRSSVLQLDDLRVNPDLPSGLFSRRRMRQCR